METNPTANSEYDVLIVGWGPTGMIAANILGRAGHKVAAFERYPDMYPLSRVGGLHDDVFRLFQEIGIIDEVWPHAHVLPEYEMLHGDDVIFASPLSAEASHGWPQLTTLFQPYFERQLNRVARSSNSVQVFHGSNVVGVVQASDHVEIEVEDTNSKERRTFRGKYLIGCDGGNSFVRRALEIEEEHLGFEQDWLVVDAETIRARPEWRDMVQVCNPEQPGSVMRMGKYHRRWAFMIMPGETKEQATELEAVWRRLAVSEAARATPDDVKVIRNAHYRFKSLLARNWRVGRAFIAGDAAHQMPPYLGQGMMSGVRDAHNLAWKLNLVLKGQASDGFLDTYEQERKPLAREVIEESVRVGRVVIERDPEKVRDRDAAMKAAQAKSVRQLVGYRPPGLTRGFIARSEQSTSRGAGETFPQGRVVANGLHGRFDDVVGRGFMIVARNGSVTEAMSEADRAFWKSLGGCIATFGEAAHDGDVYFDDSDGQCAKLLDDFNCDIMVKRADFFLFGMCPSAENLPSLLHDLRGQLGGVSKVQ